MINYPIIKIPKKYWLDVNLFNYKTFDYDDIRCIYNSPRILINDLEEINGFIEYAKEIIKDKKRKNNNFVGKLRRKYLPSVEK